MENVIGAFEARRQFGKLLQTVAVSGDTFVVERHGERIAAVVPMEVYEQWKKARADFFSNMRGAAKRANLTPEEADALADEAILAVRAAHG